jgi:hypothetical protein
MRRRAALAFALAPAVLLAAACGSNLTSHANDPQRTICFSSMECASYMKCVKGPNAINGYCRLLTEPEDAGKDAALDAPSDASDADAPSDAPDADDAATD